MSIVITVDGGGSSCRLAAFNDDGRVIERVKIDQHASLALDVDGAWQHIAQGIEVLRQRLHQHAAWQPDKLMMGLAGSLPEHKRGALLRHVPSGVLAEVVTDGQAQLTGASGGTPAVCLAVGTGSVVHWLGRDGVTGMAGGWGFPAGDQGSGAWLGMRLIQCYVQHRDGKALDSSLIPGLEKTLGTTVADIQQWTTQKQSTVVATLAPRIFEHARAGDELALALMNEAIEQCVCLVAFAPEALPVYVTGGIGEQLLAGLKERLAGRVATAQGDALHGLWLLSQRLK